MDIVVSFFRFAAPGKGLFFFSVAPSVELFSFDGAFAIISILGESMMFGVDEIERFLVLMFSTGSIVILPRETFSFVYSAIASDARCIVSHFLLR